MMEELDLIDIFQKQKPYTKSFSYKSNFLKVKSRLDYYLIAKHLTQYVHNNETKTAIGRFQKISVPYHGRLLGIPKASGDTCEWNSEGMGGG